MREPVEVRDGEAVVEVPDHLVFADQFPLLLGGEVGEEFGAVDILKDFEEAIIGCIDFAHTLKLSASAGWRGLRLFHS